MKIIDRPYRTSDAVRRRKECAEAFEKSKLEHAKKRPLTENAFPSRRCRICGKTGKGLRKVSVGSAYFLCKDHFEDIQILVEEFIDARIHNSLKGLISERSETT